MKHRIKILGRTAEENNMEDNNRHPAFLNDRKLRLLLFGGKGGVGKTTCAVGTAMYLIRNSSQSSFLLVSTDPAHSLADCMGDIYPPNNLKILELDTKKSLAVFKEKHNEKLRIIASRGTFLDDEDINRFLDLSLPGLDELMGFLDISKWVSEGIYDCIIVDTAPAGHTLRMLAMPDLIQKWIKALDTLLAKHRYMKKVFSGTYSLDDVDEFLLDLSDSVKQMGILLQDPLLCRFIPVMLAEEMSLYETINLLNELKHLKIHVTDIVVNKLYPEAKCAVCADGTFHQMQELSRIAREFPVYSLWGIPLHMLEIRGAETIGTLWDNVMPLESMNLKSSWVSLEPFLPCNVKNPPDIPSSKTKILMFAGKGGVGKTTLACATALRIASDFESRVLLFSTDPAHSLSSCLDIKIGANPARVTSRLTAMEIDAQAEFEDLKKQYTEELERFLEAISPNLDLAFEREVMEHIMDLSPPGLDEIMALTKVMDFLMHNKYDIIILDSAPTGHLIRLLELPELVDQWFKAFFDLFLKYKQIFRLPNISTRMVQMSKQIKLFRNLLTDSKQSALYGISILTEMAFQETQDLVDSCRKMKVNVPYLFLNLATPPGKCPLCSLIHERESKVKAMFEKFFSKIPQTIVYRQDEPRGLERLTQLGRNLYRPINIDKEECEGEIEATEISC